MKLDPLKNNVYGALVDYSLIRKTTLDRFKQGKILRSDICDAQTELMRVAKNYGIELKQSCPICNNYQLVYVTYAFGNKIVKSGICITEGSEIYDLTKKTNELFLYDIEVCLGCRWNHLMKKSQVKS